MPPLDGLNVWQWIKTVGDERAKTVWSRASSTSSTSSESVACQRHFLCWTITTQQGGSRRRLMKGSKRFRCQRNRLSTGPEVTAFSEFTCASQDPRGYRPTCCPRRFFFPIQRGVVHSQRECTDFKSSKNPWIYWIFSDFSDFFLDFFPNFFGCTRIL